MFFFYVRLDGLASKPRACLCVAVERDPREVLPVLVVVADHARFSLLACALLPSCHSISTAIATPDNARKSTPFIVPCNHKGVATASTRRLVPA